MKPMSDFRKHKKLHSNGVPMKKEAANSVSHRNQIGALQDKDTFTRIISASWFLILLFAIYFSIPFVVHLKHLLAGETLVSGDGLGGSSQLLYVRESIKNFDFPLWSPYLAGGQPYAEVIGGYAMYPLLWLCSLLPKILQLYAYFGLHYAIGGVAMFAFLKRIKCIPAVSLAVSFMYVFTVHMGGARKEHISLIVTALYLPAILYFLERYLQEEKLRWLFLGSAAMALQFYGGFLQYIVYSDIFLFFYLLCSGIHKKIPVKRMLKHGIAWVAAYFGMIAACVLPMAQMMYILSQSGGTGMSYEGFVCFSLHPVKLLLTIFPYILGKNVSIELLDIGYSSGMDAELVMGAAAVAVIFAAVPMYRRKFHVRFMGTAAAIILVYACIGHFPILARIAYRIPILNRVCSTSKKPLGDKRFTARYDKIGAKEMANIIGKACT